MWQRRHQNFENGQWIDCTKEDAVKFGPAGSYGGWEIRDLPSNTMPTADEIAVIQRLLDLARQVDHALDDSEEVACDGFRSHNIDGQDFADVVEALDALADLPDDKPGMTLGPAGKAEWALRRLLDPVIRGRAEHNELRRLHALTAQAPSQLGGFDAGDMASAAAQGYRQGYEQRDAEVRGALV